MSIDFLSLKRELLSNAESYLSQWLPGGKRRGREFVCGNIKGEAGDSLSINLDTGVGSDFATKQTFGDLIDVYCAVFGVDVKQAALDLGARQVDGAKPRALPPPKKTEVKLYPPPKTAPPPIFSSPDYWIYRGLDNALLFYVERIDEPEGKRFRPHSWNGSAWVNKMWPAPRPLYGNQTLSALADKPVLVVEGEKTCDAAQKIVDGRYACVSWMGGAQAVGKSDWSVLAGRKVLLWPDNDSPGVTAMKEIGQLLVGICPEVKIIDPSDLESKADAADVDFNWTEFLLWASKRVSVVDPAAPDVDFPPPLDDGAPMPDVPSLDPKLKASSALSEYDLLPILPHWRHTKTSSTPLGTIENLQALLKLLGVIVRYNVISKQEEVLIPNQAFSMDNEANAAYAWILSIQVQIGMSTANLKDFLTKLADANPYNPVSTWILSKPWDGQSRLHSLFETLRVKNQADPRILSLKNAMVRRWMVSAVAGAFRPNGVSAHGVLVLQGEQYIGKTAWIKSLVPKELGLVADGRILKPDDRDSVSQICRYWLVELGELDATFRKADIAQLKAFITKDFDIFRKPYAARDSVFARRTVFFASVNESEFLNDPTGNRRFWTIECDSINHEHGLDMQQIWAEVHALWAGGESWFLTKDEMDALNQHNESFMSKDPVEELIETRLKWDSDPKYWEYLTATDVLSILGHKNPTQAQKRKASQEIFKRNGGLRKKSHGHRLLAVPRTGLKLIETLNPAPPAP